MKFQLHRPSAGNTLRPIAEFGHLTTRSSDLGSLTILTFILPLYVRRVVACQGGLGVRKPPAPAATRVTREANIPLRYPGRRHGLQPGRRPGLRSSLI